MPELPLDVNATITRIDAPFPEQWGQELYKFTKEILAIKESLDALAISNVAQTTATSKLADLYSEEALESRASRAIAEQQGKRLLNAQGEEMYASRQPEPTTEAFHMRAPAGSPGRKREEQESGGASPTASQPFNAGDWLEKHPIEMPQHYGGTYTAQDLLVLLGKGAQGVGWEGGENTFAKLAKGQPTFQAAMNLGRTYIGAARSQSEGFNQMAGERGYMPGDGALGSNSISGPFGTNFRIPLLNSPALSGISSTLGALGTSMTIPGMGTGDVLSMEGGLMGRGWQENGNLNKPGQELFDGQSQLFGKGGVFEQIAKDPKTAELMDKAFRSGSAGIDEITKTLEEVPEAAEAANEGYAQLLNTMDEYGNFSQSTGGTHWGGQQQAVRLNQITGIPAAALKGMTESAWTQSAIFKETGVPSYNQGMIPASVKNEAMMKGFWQLAGSVGKGPGRTYTTLSGNTLQTGGLREQAARMHSIDPTLGNPETIYKMLKEGRQGTKVRGELSESAEAWKQEAFGLANKGGDLDSMLTANGATAKNFGHILRTMGAQKTADGRRMFSQGDIKDIRTNFGTGWEGAHGKELVEDKFAAVQKILSLKAGKDAEAARKGSNMNVEIELSPAARKFLQLPNKRSVEKLKANAGEGQANNGVTGYSDTPIPGSDPVVNNSTGKYEWPEE